MRAAVGRLHASNRRQCGARRASVRNSSCMRQATRLAAVKAARARKALVSAGSTLLRGFNVFSPSFLPDPASARADCDTLVSARQSPKVCARESRKAGNEPGSISHSSKPRISSWSGSGRERERRERAFVLSPAADWSMTPSLRNKSGPTIKPSAFLCTRPGATRADGAGVGVATASLRSRATIWKRSSTYFELGSEEGEEGVQKHPVPVSSR